MFLASQIGCSRVMFESDSSFAVEAINQLDGYLGPEVAIIAECKNLMLDYEKISFNHCFREANMVADEIAKYSFSNRASVVWEDETPAFISHLLVNDMSII